MENYALFENAGPRHKKPEVKPMSRRPRGLLIIALWFALSPFLAVGSAAFYFHKYGLSWSMPSGEELMAHINGDESAISGMAAERASERARASWHPLAVSVYYFAPSLRVIA